MSFVLDNSVVLVWCFQDEQTLPIMGVLDQPVETGAIEATLWPGEALNGLLTAERRGRIAADTRQRPAASCRSCRSRVDPEMAGRAWSSVAQLALQHRLTAHDAACLELAACLWLSLATRGTLLHEQQASG